MVRPWASGCHVHPGEGGARASPSVRTPSSASGPASSLFPLPALTVSPGSDSLLSHALSALCLPVHKSFISRKDKFCSPCLHPAPGGPRQGFVLHLKFHSGNPSHTPSGGGGAELDCPNSSPCTAVRLQRGQNVAPHCSHSSSGEFTDRTSHRRQAKGFL